MTARTSRSRGALAALASVGVAASVVLVAVPAHADEIRDRQYWLSEYGISQAWNTTRGAGVTVAVIDTGVVGSHEDLAGAVVGGTDVSGIGNPNGQAGVGNNPNHGTMVASLLAGRGHGTENADGVIGAAPEANILAVSMGFGVGNQSADDQIAAGVRWAVDNGADIINLSLTRNSLAWPESWDDAFLYAMENDVLIVAAAGNRGGGTTEVGAPATMPGVLVVGGLDRAGKASWDASSQGISISVSAPSEQLVGVGADGKYYEWSGTSGATPIVAGVAALVRAAHPSLSAGDVIHRITATARPVPGVATPSPIYGHGLLDAAAAVGANVTGSGASPATQLKDWIRVHRRAESDPTPPPEFTPEPMPAVPIGPDAPVADESPLGTVLPDPTQLRDVGVPLLVYAGLVSALIAWGWAFRRSVKGRSGDPIG